MSYRKIYEDKFGPIPKDDLGRSHEIHHIDGNHNNNDITNLKCISIQEHYDIHYFQKDWTACFRIMNRMKLSPLEISEIARQNAKLQNQTRIDNGTHNFLGPHMNQKRIVEGTHNFLGDTNPIYERVESGIQQQMMKEENKKRIDKGTHNFLGVSNPCYERIANGTHHFLGGEISRSTQKKLIDKRIHHFLGESNPATKQLIEGKHPSQIKVICPHCDKIGQLGPMKLWHFDNCRNK